MGPEPLAASQSAGQHAKPETYWDRLLAAGDTYLWLSQPPAHRVTDPYQSSMVLIPCR